MVKRVICTLVVLGMLIACGQEKKEKIMEEIVIEHYDKEPLYKIHHGGNCNYEILINDYPVYKSYDGFKSLTGERINPAILKSGAQTLTIKAYPIQEGGMLVKEHNAYVKVVEVDKKTDQLEELMVASLVLPSDADGGFVGAGLPYYEKTVEFRAEVPYRLTGWSESEDLSKMDQYKLQKMVENFYRKIGEYDVNEDLDKIIELNYKKDKEVFQSTYEKGKIIDIQKTEYAHFMSYAKSIELEKPYEMNLYGKNRIVCLEMKSGQRRGEGAYKLLREKEGEVVYSTAMFYLHMPEGSNKLEIIR